MRPDVAGGVQGRMTLGRGLDAARVAVGGRGEFQQVRSEAMEKGAGPAWMVASMTPLSPAQASPNL